MSNIAVTVGMILSSCLAAVPGHESSQQAGHELREWTDDTGKYHVKAAWIAFERDRIRLRRHDGSETTVAIQRLSEADKSFLRRLAFSDTATENSWPMLFTGPGEGLRGEYYRDTSLDEIGLVRVDGPLDFEFRRHAPPYEGGKPIKHIDDGWYHDFAIRWTGLLVPRYSERYTLSLEMDDGAALWLGAKMLIRSWKWQASKEYTAEADLIAGRPYPVRILYYNGPYGGAIKFRWSSKSQPKELVPRECLFLPAEASQPKPLQDALPALADIVSVKDIPLTAAVKCDSRLNKPTLFLASIPGGGFKLGWTDVAQRAHLTPLSAKFEPAGKDALTEKVDLRGLTVDRDGRTTLLMASPHDRMWLMHLDAAGQLAWRKCLVGQNGRSDNQHFLDEHFSFTGRLASEGTEIGAHFAHSWNTGGSGTHQGGYFTLIERGGKELQEDKWTVSHSLDQRVLFHAGCCFTLSAGDCFPKGLHLQNRTLGFGRVVYPDPDEREAFGNCGGFVNAQLGDLVPLDGDVATVFITKREGRPKLCFLRLAADCTVIGRHDVADLPANEQLQVVKVAPYRQWLLVAWRNVETQTKLALIDGKGRLIGEPASVPHALPVHDDLIKLPNGAVAWLTAQNGDRSVQLVIIP